MYIFCAGIILLIQQGGLDKSSPYNNLHNKTEPVPLFTLFKSLGPSGKPWDVLPVYFQ